MAQSNPETKRWEDIFQEVAQDFTDFKSFARSGSGLCLKEADIQTIIEDHKESAKEQRMQMLNKWKEKQGPLSEPVLVARIKDLVKSFHEGKVSQSTDCISLQDGAYEVYENKRLCKRNNALVYEGKQICGVPNASQPRAVKFLAYNDENLKEAETVAKLDHHENVVSTYQVGTYKLGFLSKYIFIVMELCSEITLFDYLIECQQNNDVFNESERWGMVIQIFRALDFIHKRNIIHRDFKSHNILFSTKDMKLLKLVDFGLSKTITRETATLTKSVGTTGYMAPEIHNMKGNTKKSDIYSAGITKVEILSNGRHPFGDDLDLRNYKIKNNEKPCLRQLLVSDRKTAKKLIKPLLEFDPDNRPTAEEVLKNITHPIQRSNQEISDRADTGEASSIILFHVVDKHLYLYKPSIKEWTKMLHTKEPHEFSTVKLDRRIYTLSNKEVHRLTYQDQTSRWKRRADMKEDHGNTPSAAVMNDAIYVCGRGNMYPISDAEKYNSIMDQWTSIRNMNLAKRRPGVVAADADSLYCIGGWDEKAIHSSSVERYQETTNEWTSITPTVRPTYKASAVEFNGSLYVADNHGVQRYDIQNASWRELNLHSQWLLIKTLRFTTKILVVDNKLYIIGSTEENQIRIYLLDAENETMSLVEDLKNIFINASVAV